MENKTYLFASAHTDDAELACGAYMFSLASEGHDIHHIAFSSAPNEIGGGSGSMLEGEFKRANRILGVKRCSVLHYPIRRFHENRQEILQDLINIKVRIGAQVVVGPSRHDTHQDHQVLAQEIFRAFKHQTILGYELPWNNLQFCAQSYFRFGTHALRKKITAMQAYKSQEKRPYCDAWYLQSLARTRGLEVGDKYAEAFEVTRMII